MSKELKTKTVLYAFAFLLALYSWWDHGALDAEAYMIWMGGVFIIGMIEAFGYIWDITVLSIKRLRGK